MKSLIQAELYQLKRNKIVIAIFIITLVIQGVLLGEAGEDCQSLTEYIVYNLSTIFSVVMMFILIAAPALFGEDYNDKTIDYSLFGGYKRSEVFYAKLIATEIFIIVGACVQILIGLVGAWMITGNVGDMVSIISVVCKVLIFMLIVGRMGIEMVFITTVVKNKFIGMLLGFAISEVVMILISTEGELETAKAWFMGAASALMVGMYKVDCVWSITGKAKDFLYFATDWMNAGNYLLMAGITILFSVLFAFLGRRFFEKDDFR